MKKVAVIALTPSGGRLAAKISGYFSGDLFGKRGRCEAEGTIVFDSLSVLLRDIVYHYDAFIMVMATGIVVRVFAPYLVHKSVDPAVVVIDEAGNYAISLLSGHLGGANELTREVAAMTGALPVITTATDVNGQSAADIIAVQLGLRIVNIEQLKRTNAALAAGQKVVFYIDRSLPKADSYFEALTKQEQSVVMVDMAAIASVDMTAGQSVSVMLNPSAELAAHCLVLSPGRLIAGIGCRRNTPRESIMHALAQACAAVNMEIGDIAALASTVVKYDEQGLLESAAQLSVPIEFYENEVIAAAIEEYHLPISPFVEKQIGVGNVCEATALLKSRSKKLVLRKTKYPQVTVALAWEK